MLPPGFLSSSSGTCPSIWHLVGPAQAALKLLKEPLTFCSSDAPLAGSTGSGAPGSQDPCGEGESVD